VSTLHDETTGNWVRVGIPSFDSGLKEGINYLYRGLSELELETLFKVSRDEAQIQFALQRWGVYIQNLVLKSGPKSVWLFFDFGKPPKFSMTQHPKYDKISADQKQNPTYIPVFGLHDAAKFIHSLTADDEGRVGGRRRSDAKYTIGELLSAVRSTAPTTYKEVLIGAVLGDIDDLFEIEIEDALALEVKGKDAIKASSSTRAAEVKSADSMLNECIDRVVGFHPMISWITNIPSLL
jgi:hypothetical protein